MKQNYDLPKRLAKQATKEADDALCSQHLKGIFDDGDPNNPKYNNRWNYATGQYVNLFGYNQTGFMAKQHKQ